jgi:glycosyltransferase involved in cell wall biosynthesis
VSEGGSRERLLFLCQNLPYPPDGGALIRSYHTLRLLAERFDVTALCFYRRSSRPVEASVRASLEGLGELARAEAFPIPQEHRRARLVWDHVRSVVTGRAYTRYAYESRQVRRRIRDLIARDQVDVVHVDSLDLVAYLPMLRRLPVVLAHHNVESRLLERRAESESGLRRWYLGLQARLTAREEARWCGRVALNTAVSAEDADGLRRIAPDARVVTVPNGVDTEAFAPAPPGLREGIVFVGGHTWFPNRDGMAHFADEILPLIRAEWPEVAVTWVGRADDETRAAYAAKGIDMTGYVDDIRPHVDRAACFIVPLRVGGGTRLKILDAWAMGKAVVSTSRGCEGLDARDGENLLVADEPEPFARAVLAVVREPELRLRLETGGRETAVRSYDWSAIGEGMWRALERAGVTTGVTTGRSA